MSHVGSLRPPSLESDSPELAADYDETSVYQLNNGKILIAALKIATGETILDVGAGTGQLGAYVAELVGPTGTVIGVDPLPTRVEIARRRNLGNFESRLGRAEDLSQFADATFDVAYLNSVFHWVSDKPRALREVFRVLKPGGRFGLNTINPRHPHEIALLTAQALIEARIDPGQAGSARLVPEVLRSMVAKAGFVDYEGVERTIVDLHPDASRAIAWSTSSAFGNFPSGLGNGDRARLHRALARLIEAKRTPQGIRLERHLLFVTARRPAAR